MLEFMCPSLHRLGLLLQAAYTRRDTADRKDLGVIVEAELNLRRVHNLIAHHRSFCPRCRYNEALSRMPPKNDRPKSDVAPSDLAS